MINQVLGSIEYGSLFSGPQPQIVYTSDGTYTPNFQTDMLLAEARRAYQTRKEWRRGEMNDEHFWEYYMMKESIKYL